MSKIMTVHGQQYEAERIVKTSKDIIGYNGEQEVFAFRGISDFSGFALADGQEWDEPDNIENYLLDLDFRLSLIELGL